MSRCESCWDNARLNVKATYKCKDCGMLLCEECAEGSDFVCECAERTIFKIKEIKEVKEQ